MKIADKSNKRVLCKPVSMFEFANHFPDAFVAIKHELEADGEGPLVDNAETPVFAVSQDGRHAYWNGGGDTYVVVRSTKNIGQMEEDESICAFMDAMFVNAFK